VKPKNHNYFKEGIADEVGVHKEVVDDFVTYYYAQVRKALSNMKAVNIYIDGLGTFSMKKNKVEKAIKRNKSILGNLKKRTYNGMEKTHAVNNKLEMQENALTMIEEAIKEKNKFKQSKNEA
tara:strand:- start:5905 stop:6270 length:366 start_codon:yes stop_codon:yes gene_type:complete